MKKLQVVMNSDSINRYGYRFSVGALISGVYDACLMGVPTLTAHDQSRPIGWIFPHSVHIEPGLTRAVGISHIADDANDWKHLEARFNHHYYKTLIEPNHVQIDELRALLTSALQGQERVVISECVSFCESGLAERTFANLFATADKDGLISLKELEPIGSGIYKVGELVVFAHHYFRRSFYRLNSLNYPLLNNLQELASMNSTAKVALDPDMVGLAKSYSGEKLELQYWWGPKFTDNFDNLSLGVTHHEGSESDRAFWGVSSTQFRWGSDGTNYIFEAEELRDTPTVSDYSNLYGCRYVHSIVDKSKGFVEHLDGAVREYTEDKMLGRLDVTLDKAPRDTQYTKLWRIDQLGDVSLWKRLLSDYYRDNYLVGEYLGGVDKEVVHIHENTSRATEKTLIEQFVPYSIQCNQGIRVAISFSNIENYSTDIPLAVIPLDRITTRNGNEPYIESLALELQKILKRTGVHLHIPDDTRFVSFRDFYVNFPLIYVSRQEHFRSVTDVITKIINMWEEQAHDRVVCYRIGLPIASDRVANFSFFGHVKDLKIWLENAHRYPPDDIEALRDWAEQVSTFLRDTYPVADDQPPLFETLMDSGVLSIDRKCVILGNYEVQKTDEEFVYSIAVPEQYKDLAESLCKAGIVPGMGVLIERSKCTKCKEPYESCDCSKLFDQGVAQEILEMLPFPFWTDKPLM